MTNPIHDSNESQTLAALEAELRRLPPPEPPADLEAALISAIPSGIPSRRAARQTRWALSVASAAAAAAVAVAALMVMHFRETAGPPERHATRDVLNDTRPAFIVEARSIPISQETDPCNILPPLRGTLF